MKIKEWVAFFSDKRFGARFKLANLIMNDYLHNYLAIDMIPLENAKKYADKHPDASKEEIEKVQKDIRELFSM